MLKALFCTKKIASISQHWSSEVANPKNSKRVVGKDYTKSYQRPVLAESIHKVCMKTLGFSGEAELTAMRVCEDVETWLENKDEVTTDDIKRIAATSLKKYNPPAAHAYHSDKKYILTKDMYGFTRL